MTKLIGRLLPMALLGTLACASAQAGIQLSSSGFHAHHFPLKRGYTSFKAYGACFHTTFLWT